MTQTHTYTAIIANSFIISTPDETLKQGSTVEFPSSDVG